MRVRATRGLKTTAFHGNFSIRGNDLLALPNCHPDFSFALELVRPTGPIDDVLTPFPLIQGHEEQVLSTTTISIQAALLYTTSGGERRIRVHTMAVPVTNIVEEIVKSIDIDCLCNIMARQALDTALKTGLDSARHRLQTVGLPI